MKENTYVRTAVDLERKYNLVGIQQAVKQAEDIITKTNGEIENFTNQVIKSIDNLQEQLDGKVETFYGNEIPTLENEPATLWNDYNEHINDLYYNRESGIAYRFVNDNGFKWRELDDIPLQEALSIANEAKTTADGKKQVFVAPPVPPYQLGDLWINNQELYVCQIEKTEDQQYEDGDFVKATKYTDDTVALTAKQASDILENRMLEVESNQESLQLNFQKAITTEDITKTELANFLKYIRFVDGNIILGDANSQYSLKIENDRIVIYYNQQPFSYWVQDQFTVSQLNLGNFAFIPRNNGSLGFRKVK